MGYSIPTFSSSFAPVAADKLASFKQAAAGGDKGSSQWLNDYNANVRGMMDSVSDPVSKRQIANDFGLDYDPSSAGTWQDSPGISDATKNWWRAQGAVLNASGQWALPGTAGAQRIGLGTTAMVPDANTGQMVPFDQNLKWNQMYPGIINNAVGSSQPVSAPSPAGGNVAPVPMPAQAGAPAGVAPAVPSGADNVDLVESRVNNIARSDSPLMQQARGAALQQMNDRGLINSSLGIGAAQDAVIRNALPIAQQDAGAVNFVRNREDEQAFTTGRDATQQGYTQANMQLGNQLQSGLNQQQQGYTQSNMRLGNDLQQSNMELQSRLQTSMDNANRAWQSNESVLNRDLQLKMQQTQNALTQEAQKTQVGMTLASTYYNTVSTILMDPNLDAAAKQAQIDKALSNYQSMLQIVQKSTGIDLSQVGPIFQTDGKKTTQPAPAAQANNAGDWALMGRAAINSNSQR